MVLAQSQLNGPAYMAQPIPPLPVIIADAMQRQVVICSLRRSMANRWSVFFGSGAQVFYLRFRQAVRYGLKSVNCLKDIANTQVEYLRSYPQSAIRNPQSAIRMAAA